MYQKKKDTNQEIEIKPQWVSVKEELVADFMALSDSFSDFSQNVNNSGLKKEWFRNLRTLYLKIRLKIVNNDNYKDFVKDMDNWIFEWIPISIKKTGYLTRRLLQFVEEIGLTRVETPKENENTPYTAIKGKFQNYSY